MKQIKVVPHNGEYLVKIPANANGYLHPIYRTGDWFLGELLDENWGVPDAELKYRFKSITTKEHAQIYDMIYQIMETVNKLFYKEFLAFIEFKLDPTRTRTTSFINAISKADTVLDARSLLRQKRLDQYVILLDIYLDAFEKEIGL